MSDTASVDPRPNALSAWPDARGRFGDYGGRFVAETLMPNILELEAAYEDAKRDVNFQREMEEFLRDYVGKPSPIYFAERLTEEFGGAKIWFKRDELNHTGSHKINNCLGQVLLAKRMGKTRIIAETGAGQHGVATALACALLGLKCRVYMGAKDVERQQPNVFRMKLMGAEVIPVTAGSGTLKDAVNEAMRDWSANYDTAHYLLGTAAGPHPFPSLVRDFQRMIGAEAREQVIQETGRLPDHVIACVGGGSNAIGMFNDFIADEGVGLIGVEPAGKGLNTLEHGAAIAKGTKGILHGAYTFIMQNSDGQIEESYSVSAGLDYPAVGPQHAHLAETGRAQYVSVTDDEALDAFQLLARKEGIIPALESAHAIAYAVKLADAAKEPTVIVVNLSGRGDKDLAHVHTVLQGGSL